MAIQKRKLTKRKGVIHALSKSKLLAFRQCPKRLWLEVKRPELIEDSAATMASFKVGHQVGDIARSIFDPEDNGILIDPQQDGFDAAFSKTDSLLGSFQPIFEAALTNGDALALADVMLPLNKRGKPRWRMIEVKSSTSVKDYHRDDVAVQAYIAKKAGIDVRKVEVAVIDNQWVYPGKGDYQGLLITTDLTEEAMGRNKEVGKWIVDAQKVVARRSEPRISTGSHCSDPYSCGFYEYCSVNEPKAKFPVAWLPNIRTKALKKLVREDGVDDLRDVPNDLLNERQLRVKRHSVSGKAYFDKAGAAEDLATYKLPAYFLDFESINLAVPIWKGRRPYQQVVFQYSLHKLSRSGDLKHTFFLDLSGNDPSRPFAEKLIKDCGKTGPIFVYNIGFESTRVKELAARLPRLKQPLLSLNDRMVDLWPIAKNRYYHPSQQGSWSIKSVLPAIAPELSYESLTGVNDGGMAMEAYSEAISVGTTAERKAEIELQLLEYCKLDTFALVKLWAFFSGYSSTINDQAYPSHPR
jgi:CRISPR/Cas system-associated exonuclease Cas4 (RecB family)